MRHLNDEELILYHYGEWPRDRLGLGRSPKAVARHLDTCEPCRASYAALCAVLAASTAWEPPSRDAAYGERVWARVGPRLVARTSMTSGDTAAASLASEDGRTPARGLSTLLDLLRPRRLALAGYGVAVGMLIVFLAQPVSKEAVAPRGAPAAEAWDQARERVLLTSLGDHFDRSQIMLLELANHEDEALDATGAQAWAQDLIATNRLYRQAATTDGETAFAEVLGDLERVLLHVAHAPEERPVPPVTLERTPEPIVEATGADLRDMLFKLRVAGDTVRARERAAFRSMVEE